MKKLILILALFTLTACQSAEEPIMEAELPTEPATTMAVPAVLGSDVEEMIVEEAIESTEIPEESEEEKTPEPVAETPLRVINISAARWEFTPSVIRAKQGEKVLIKVNNTDTTHNFSVPKLGMNSNTNEFMLETSEKGEFEFFCANFCGSGHGEMKGIIIIE